MDLKYNMIIGLFLISLLSYAQKTGIGTTDPLSDLHGISTSSDTKYNIVTLTSRASIFSTSLETLAKVTGCTATSGHTLSYNAQTKKISVSFADSPTYYPNAGLFVINKIMKVRQTK